MERTNQANQAKQAYFVDGYHGGIKGHMPLGSWADVVRRLELHPEWKLCLDVEPISWETLRRTDPRSYDAIKRHLNDPAGRVEIVAGSYAQPFGWVIGGESNIRHLTRGMEIVREHFPGVAVDTYATQEPCWSSSFPQILRSLGFKRAVLKNPGTAWAGYASGTDRETVLWVGPDGTSIPCVPRYACEELLNAWETEAGYMKPDFIDKCIARGIAHPVGSFLQDLGWPAYPRLDGDRIRYATWREYMEEIAAPPSEAWLITQEDIRCTLPWGEGTLQRMSREVRSAEQAVLAAEKMASLASVVTGFAYPEEKLREAWDQLLLSQHHDAWICATTRDGREKWAWQAGAQSWMAELLSNDIRERAMDSFSQGRDEDGANAVNGENGEYGENGEHGEYGIRVFNLSGIARMELTEIEVPAMGAAAIRVRSSDGALVPSQIAPTRICRDDGSLQACKLIFEAEPPAMGYRDYAIEYVAEADGQTSAGQDDDRSIAFATVFDDHAVIETDMYRIRIDTARGGTITEWFDRSLNRSFVSAERPFNDFAGYLIQEERWASSAEAPVELTIRENGPLRVVLEMKGKFGNADFVSTLTVARGRRALDCQVRFRFDGDTWVGDPWEMAPENRNTERRRSHHNARYKLQARFPVAFDRRKVYKNFAFDVTESRHADTHFERWDEIKHSVILNWVDAYDEELDLGLAIFSDRTTGYSHGEDEPLALTLGWGGEGGFWWGKRPLAGVQEARYAIVPHGERWDRAGIAQESMRWAEPLLPTTIHGFAGSPGSLSLLHVTDPSIEVSSVRREGRDLLVRLYNSAPKESSFSVAIRAESGDVAEVELDGKLKERLRRTALPNRGFEASLSLRRHGLATLRICDIRYSQDDTNRM